MGKPIEFVAGKGKLAKRLAASQGDYGAKMSASDAAQNHTLSGRAWLSCPGWWISICRRSGSARTCTASLQMRRLSSCSAENSHPS